MARSDLDIPMPAHAGSSQPGQGSSWRVSRSRGVLDPSTRRLVLIAGGVGGTLLLLVGAYTLSSRHPAGIPVIEADRRPLREKPLNAGGLEIAGADDAILGGSSGKEGMAPPPESPAPAALIAQERGAEHAGSPAADMSIGATRGTAGASAPNAVQGPNGLPGLNGPPAPAAAAPVAPSPLGSSVSAGSAPVNPLTGGAEPRSPYPTRAVAQPKAAAVSPAAVSPAAVSPAALPAALPAAAAPAGTAAAGPLGGSSMQVQLAALPTEQAAMSEWQRLTRKLPEMLSTRHPSVSRTEHDGKIYFRLRTGGFSEVADATAFCHRVREKGAICSIATF